MSDHLPPSLERRILASGLDHVEGVCWDPDRACVWGGGEAGQIYRIELNGTVRVVAVIDGGALLGLALDAQGRLYVCDTGNHQVWRMNDDGSLERFGAPIDYPNYPAFGPDGRLYVSDSGSFTHPTGTIVAIDEHGVTNDVAPRALAFANGIAIDETTLWVVESAAPGVSAMSLDGGPLELVIEMQRCVPDGLAFDSAGGLLISCYQPNQLWRWTRDGGLELLFDDWTGEYILSPTNLAFYGDGLERIVLASLCGHDLITVAAAFPGTPVRRP